MFEDEEQKKSGKFVATLECHTPTGQFVIGKKLYKLSRSIPVFLNL